MTNNILKAGYLENFSPKVKLALVAMVDDFYRIEQEHTVVVMPFFGLLHSQGNESKPILNFIDINLLDIINKKFKDVVVYFGENNYIYSYDLPLSSIEDFVYEQNMLSRIVNRTTNFGVLTEQHEEILNLYEKAIVDFDLMKEYYPLPYRTALDVRNPEDLILFIKNLDERIKKEDKNNKICLICPISYLIDKSIETYDLILETMKSIGGNLYFAQNQSYRYLYTSDYQILYNDQYSEKIIQSIQDFARVYNEDITKIAKEKLNFDEILRKIQKGEYGNSEQEIINRLDKIDIEKIYTQNFDKKENVLYKS